MHVKMDYQVLAKNWCDKWNIYSSDKENIITIDSLTLIIKETLQEIDCITPLNIKTTLSYIVDIFIKHYNLIEYLESSDDEIIKITRDKNIKQYLKKYISAFEINAKLYDITDDINRLREMHLNIWLFKLYLQDIEEFHKLRSSMHTFFIANPDYKHKIKMIRSKAKRKKLTEREINFLFMYERNKYISSLLKFFQYHTLTKKKILTSLSISIYKAMTSSGEIKKHQAKALLETMFYKLDIPTTIRLKDIENAYIKTVVHGLVIFTYPNKNGTSTLYNLEEFNEILSRKMEEYPQNSVILEKFENYQRDKISLIQAKLGL